MSAVTTEQRPGELGMGGGTSAPPNLGIPTLGPLGFVLMAVHVARVARGSGAAT